MHPFVGVVISLIVFASSSSASPESLKKITIVETNNSPDYLLIGSWVSKKADVPYLKKLKAYVQKKGFNPASGSELDFVKEALNWVTSQWAHDGVNEPPESFRALDILQAVHNKQARYRCVEYGLVLSELLQAHGFVARSLAMRSPDVAYGGYGRGHVTMEVWLNDLGKWIFLDPQFGTYMTLPSSSAPLNYYEIFQQRKAGNWDKLEVHFSANSSLSAFDPDDNPSAPKNTIDQTREYKKFLNQYFGFITVPSRNGEHVSLLLESQNQPLTFQGRQADNMIFTRNFEIIYPEMNRVVLLLSYRDKEPIFPKLIKDLKINSEEDYLKKMGSYAAKPRYHVRVESAGQLGGESFEYRESKEGPWVAIKGNKFDWDAMKLSNYLEARSVNPFGRRGPATFISLKYE